MLLLEIYGKFMEVKGFENWGVPKNAPSAHRCGLF